MHRLLSGCLLLATVRLGAAEPLQVVRERDVYRILPARQAVENVDDRLFRSLDGSQLHFGPDEQGRFFVIRGATDARELKAPSKGKAYLDATGSFVIWYDTLAEGIHFPNGFQMRLEKPAETRFGVSYDAGYFYTATSARTEIYATRRPFDPLLRLEGVYALKVVPHGDRLYVLAHERFAGQAVRTTLCLVFQEIAGRYEEMRRHPLPDYLTPLDLDPAGERVLMLDTAPALPVLYEQSLRKGQLTSLGPTDEFAFYLAAGFRLNADGP